MLRELKKKKAGHIQPLLFTNENRTERISLSCLQFIVGTIF